MRVVEQDATYVPAYGLKLFLPCGTKLTLKETAAEKMREREIEQLVLGLEVRVKRHGSDPHLAGQGPNRQGAEAFPADDCEGDGPWRE